MFTVWIVPKIPITNSTHDCGFCFLFDLFWFNSIISIHFNFSNNVDKMLNYKSLNSNELKIEKLYVFTGQLSYYVE